MRVNPQSATRGLMGLCHQGEIRAFGKEPFLPPPEVSGISRNLRRYATRRSFLASRLIIHFSKPAKPQHLRNWGDRSIVSLRSAVFPRKLATIGECLPIFVLRKPAAPPRASPIRRETFHETPPFAFSLVASHHQASLTQRSRALPPAHQVCRSYAKGITGGGQAGISVPSVVKPSRGGARFGRKAACPPWARARSALTSVHVFHQKGTAPCDAQTDHDLRSILPSRVP